jgi:predicted dehydrogenase/threonine dehydrogenase-like Zn-dependent dehydrogenase
MRQVVQSFRTGDLVVDEVPSPILRARGILVRTAASLVSAGTERMVVDFAEKNLIEKARARPDLVRQVVDKAKREGVLSTLDSVRNRLDQPLPLGYSSAGVVVAVGDEAGSFEAGDRVACAGSGFACHAEVAYIPRNLAVKLPEGVAFESGAFVTLGAIALQGGRQAGVELGQKVAVIGLGLLGQLTVQLLKAAGCQVFGVDLSPARIELALGLGADAACNTGEAVGLGRGFSGGRGFDAVLITADTRSDEPVETAGELARDRGVVVAVGAVGLTIPRKLYYEKELDFRLSRSYGPGRYDPAYEEQGLDYPYGYVRWTEQRNMEAVARLLATGAVRVAPLITHRFPIDDAVRAYDVITGKTGEPSLGVVLEFDPGRDLPNRIDLAADRAAARPEQPAVRLGLLGAGNFVNTTLLPAARKVAGLEMVGIASGSGLTARSTGSRFGFAYCASELSALLEDGNINWLAVVTRHDLHARQAIAGMRAGKDVFVEKPLALDASELADVLRAQHETGARLMVGFNRRFAPMARRMQQFLAGRHGPLLATYRVNAGAVPAGHWTQDPTVGGGRVVGEACHFLDLLQFLTGSTPTEVYARALQTGQGHAADEVVILMSFADGSVGTVAYSAGGDKSFSKERVEVIGDGRVAVLEDFRTLELIAGGRRTCQRERLRPDKGHRGEWEALVSAARSGGPAPISLQEIVATHLASYAAIEGLRAHRPVPVQTAEFLAEIQGSSPLLPT